MPTDATPTTITIPTYVRKMLDRYKRPGQSYANLIIQLIEAIPSPRFLQELDRIDREEEFVDLEALEKEPGFY